MELKVRMDKEIWVPVFIKGKITKYKVSNFGRIKNANNNQILKHYKGNKGYLLVGLHLSKNESITRTVHGLVAQGFIYNPEPDLFNTVDHLDYNKNNNRVDNLEWVSRSENSIRAHLAGRCTYLSGIDNGWAKYTDEKIHEICLDMTKSNDFNSIADKHDVPIKYIRSLYYGTARKSITSKYDFVPTRETSSKISREMAVYIAKLIIKGKSNIEISKIVGIDRQIVNHVRIGNTHNDVYLKYKLNEIYQPAHMDDKMAEEICKLIVDGKSGVEIKNITGQSLKKISAIRNGWSWTQVSSKYGIKPNVSKLLDTISNDV